jgi:Methylamine utilisation protein MauE
MDVVLLASRMTLAVVLLIAAVAKALDRSGTRDSLERFGVPVALAPAASVALPLVELAVAVALVPVASAWAAALAALVLFVAFTAALVVGLLRGAEAPCNCFGASSTRPVGPAALARNVVLIGLAAFVVAAGRSGTSAVGWIGDLSTSAVAVLTGGLLLALAVVLNGAFLWQLFRQNGRLWVEIEALRDELAHRAPVTRSWDLGRAAPRFALPDLNGRVVALEDLLEDGRGLWLVFSDPRCDACDLVLPEIARLQSYPLADPWPVLLSIGSVEDNRAKAAAYGIELVLLHADAELPRSLGVGGTPGLVSLDAAGRVVSEPVLGAPRVADALRAQPVLDTSEILAVGSG